MITGRLVTAVADSAPATNNSKRAPGAKQKSFKTILHLVKFCAAITSSISKYLVNTSILDQILNFICITHTYSMYYVITRQKLSGSLR